MSPELLVFAYHFEPTERFTTHFVDYQGTLLVKQSYQVSVSDEQAHELTNLVAAFPSELTFGWMCPPIYRDVLMWQQADGQVIRIFQLCFECDQYLLSDGSGDTTFFEPEDSTFAELIRKLRALVALFDEEINFVRQSPL